MKESLRAVRDRVAQRSSASREHYINKMKALKQSLPNRKSMSCSNLAHGVAVCSQEEKKMATSGVSANIGIVTAFNDMLSAHAPFYRYPEEIKKLAVEFGATAQVAGGVPAMCDGVIQGQISMDISLFSRDQIALSTAIALSHNMFDSAILLGVCDKIAPGLLMGALRFGYLPTMFIPAGPMRTGVENSVKKIAREDFIQGKIDKAQLLDVEMGSYHSEGICTFYGTANTNQLLLEFMGLQLPGSSQYHPDTQERRDIMRDSVKIVSAHESNGVTAPPLYEVISVESILNAVIGLVATGGSTNHTIHLPAIAAMAGIQLQWRDIEDISKAVPLLTRIYPSGNADINSFYAVGGTAALIDTLCDNGLFFENVKTILGEGLAGYRSTTQNKNLIFSGSKDDIIRTCERPFSETGGIRVIQGNIGEGVSKVSAISQDRTQIKAPAAVFHDQQSFQTAFKEGKLNKDCVVVISFQGPAATGMPEFHTVIPALSILMKKGHNIAFMTDARLSGASGDVPSVLHITPEASKEGVIGFIRDGDVITLDFVKGSMLLEAQETLEQRKANPSLVQHDLEGAGREMFAHMRGVVSPATQGATIFTMNS